MGDDLGEFPWRWYDVMRANWLGRLDWLKHWMRTHLTGLNFCQACCGYFPYELHTERSPEGVAFSYCDHCQAWRTGGNPR